MRADSAGDSAFRFLEGCSEAYLAELWSGRRITTGLRFMDMVMVIRHTGPTLITALGSIFAKPLAYQKPMDNSLSNKWKNVIAGNLMFNRKGSCL